MKLGSEGLGTTEQEDGLGSRGCGGWKSVWEMHEFRWIRWMSVGEHWSLNRQEEEEIDSDWLEASGLETRREGYQRPVSLAEEKWLCE